MGTANIIHSADEAHQNQGPFATHAADLRKAGWAVMPANGKEPLVSGFTKWRNPPGQKLLEKWIPRFQNNDIVAVAALCCPRRGERGVIIVDPDDQEALNPARDLFGDTPSRVLTRRGEHWGYRLPDNIGDVSKLPINLRHKGINLDLKFGTSSGIVAMPMSVHEKDHDICYQWAPGSGPGAIAEAPRLPTDKLKRLLEWDDQPQPEPVEGMGRKASRHLSLNDYLCKKVWLYFPHDWSGFLAEAYAWNDGAARERIGQEPLDDEGVMKMVLGVWHNCEKGKLKPMHGSRGVFRGTRDELTPLSDLNPKRAPDALYLLLTLRLDHSARCERGETFAICPMRWRGIRSSPDGHASGTRMLGICCLSRN